MDAVEQLVAEDRVWREQADVIALAILTAQRVSEVCSADWRDIDMVEGLWRQPTNKSQRPHTVPLSASALRILQRRRTDMGEPRGGLVLPGPLGANQRKGINNVFLTVRKRAGVFCRLHDCRRGFASAVAEAGVSFEVADFVLNHAQSASRPGMIPAAPNRREQPLVPVLGAKP